MSAALSGVLKRLGDLDHAALSQVISTARDLRAAAWIKRLSELVAVPLTVSMDCEHEYDDNGGTYPSWSASITGPNGLSFSDMEMEEGAGDVESEAAVRACFVMADGATEEEANAVIAEFRDLVIAYGAYASADGDDEEGFTITPAARPAVAHG